MQYLILIYGDEQRFAQLSSDPAAQKALYAAYSATAARCAPPACCAVVPS